MAAADLGCVSLADVKLNFEWELSPAVQGLKADVKDLFIPKSKLKAGKTYTCTLICSLSNKPQDFVSTSATVEVTSLPLEASVKGPATVGSTKELKIEARVNDPDESTETTKYFWTLYDSTGGSVYKDFKPISIPSTEQVTINALDMELKAGASYKVCI